MIRRLPESTRTDTLFPDTTLFRSGLGQALERIGAVGQALQADVQRLPEAGVAADDRTGRAVFHGQLIEGDAEPGTLGPERRDLRSLGGGLAARDVAGADVPAGLLPGLGEPRREVPARRLLGVVRPGERRVGEECGSTGK